MIEFTDETNTPHKSIKIKILSRRYVTAMIATKKENVTI